MVRFWEEVFRSRGSYPRSVCKVPPAFARQEDRKSAADTVGAGIAAGLNIAMVVDKKAPLVVPAADSSGEPNIAPAADIVVERTRLTEDRRAEGMSFAAAGRTLVADRNPVADTSPAADIVAELDTVAVADTRRPVPGIVADSRIAVAVGSLAVDTAAVDSRRVVAEVRRSLAVVPGNLAVPEDSPAPPDSLEGALRSPVVGSKAVGVGIPTVRKPEERQSGRVVAPRVERVSWVEELSVRRLSYPADSGWAAGRAVSAG